MNFFEPSHLIIVGIIVLLLFGGERLPELMRGVGKGVGELKKGIDEGKRQLASAIAEHQIEEHQAEEINFVPPADTVHYGEDPLREHHQAEQIEFVPPTTGSPGAEGADKTRSNEGS